MAKEAKEKVMNVDSDKRKALEAAIAQIEKDFGKGSIMKLGSGMDKMNVEVVPTGCLSLDLALGLGGIPKGRIIEVYGPESSGKTTVALHMVAEVQKAGGIAGFIDAEHALDPVYAKAIGVNIDELYISQPDSGEQALEITETMVRSGAVDIVIVDSVAALVPKAEIDGDMGDSHVGLQARLMSQALRKLTSDAIKQGGDVVGNRTKIKVVKNKIAPPFKEAQFDIMFGQGISRTGDVLDIAVDDNIVVKSGAWFSYNGEKIGQGRENVKIYLDSNPEVFKEIEAKVRETHAKKASDVSSEEPFLEEDDEQKDFDGTEGSME